eukprot:m51a1_g2261 hypothetical protein (274) ;mRNA; r:332895-334510
MFPISCLRSDVLHDMRGEPRAARPSSPPDSATPDPSSTPDDDISERLRAIRELQRERSLRPCGVTAEQLTHASSSPPAGSDADPAAPDTKPPALSSGAPSSEMAASRMQRYIDQKLASELADQRPRSADGADGSAAPAEGEGEQAEEQADAAGEARDAEAEAMRREADRTNWLTGIAEVELPLEYKLRNIEETERAKRRLMGREDPEPEKQQPSGHHRKRGARAETEAIVSAASSGHRGHFFMSESREDARVRSSTTATDDMVMERFKKRFRY